MHDHTPAPVAGHQHGAACACYTPPTPPACTHTPASTPAPIAAPASASAAVAPASAAKWIGIGVGGSFLAVTLAVSMVAFAIGAVATTVCLLVLRSIWAQSMKDFNSKEQTRG